MKYCTLVFFAVLVVAIAPQAAGQSAAVIDPDKAFRMEVSAAPEHLNIRFSILPKHYLYRDRFKLTMDGVMLGAVDQPEGERHRDPHFGDVSIFREFVLLRVPYHTGGKSGRYTLRVTAQGCADSGFCYAPFEQRATLWLRPRQP
jgi:thiol:disulfide interchange protein DsbD